MILNFALLTTCSISLAGPAVLIEEDGIAIQPLSQRSSLQKTYAGQEFADIYELREKRRVGVGLQMAGAGGLYGIFAELNANPSNSALIGFGGGPGYSSFYGNWKYLLSESRLSPYTGLGFAHWYDATGAKSGGETSNPKFLSSQFLTAQEKESGRFQVNLITANLGVQYHVLSGPYVGFSFFAEIDLMMRLSKFSLAPTGSVGSTFYF